MPLAVGKARIGYRVIGVDVQDPKVQMINEGINYISVIVDSDLSRLVQEGEFKAITHFDLLRMLVQCV